MEDERQTKMSAAQQQVEVLRQQASATRRTAAGIDRAGARVTAGLLRQLDTEVRTGVLATRWVEAKRDAHGKVPPEEVEVAALAILMADLIREGGKQVQAEAQRLDGDGRYLLGRADAMEEMLELMASVPKPAVDVE